MYNVCINVLILHLLGTGKSSIVCAMCLGLGGRPTLLGRAKEVCTAVGCVYLNAVDASLLSLSLSSPKNTSLFLLPLSLFYPSSLPPFPPLFPSLLLSLNVPLPTFLPPLPSFPPSPYLCRSRILSSMESKKGLSRSSCTNHEGETLSLDVT